MTSNDADAGKSTVGAGFPRAAGRASLLGAVLLLGAMSWVLGWGPASNYDVWRNLAVGRWIVHHHDVPRQDPFTFTEGGAPWTDYEWLAELAFWGAYRSGSLAALSLLRVAFVWGTALMLLAQFRGRVRGAYWALVIAAAPALLLSEFHLLVRPHLWSLLLAPLLVWWIDEPRRWRAAGVAVLFALWANVHSGTLGILVLGFTLAGGVLRTDRVKTVAAAMGGLLLNPYGWRIVLPLLSILKAQAPDRMQVTEWMGVSLHQMPGFWIYLGVSALLLLIPGRGRRRWDAVVLAGFGILSLKAVRMVPYAVLLAAPGNAEALWLLVRRWRGPIAPASGWAAATAAVVALVAPRLPLSPTTDPRTIPEAAASYVDSRGLKLRCYNEMHHGAYLIWRWFPRLTVYMDNRTELFADLAATERAACEDVTSFVALLESWGITGAVLDYPWKWGETETATYYPLFKFLGWQTVAWDDGGILMLAPRAGHDSLIHADAFRVLDPFLIDPPHAALTPADREVQLAESRRALAETPGSARAWQIWANIASSAHRPATALEGYAAVARLNRDDPDIHARTALALEKLGRYEEAAREWKRQASRKLDLPVVWFNLGRLALVSAEPDEARSWLAKATRARPDEKSWQGLLAMAQSALAPDLVRQQATRRATANGKERDALAAMESGRWENAESLLREAIVLVPSAATCHQNLGACLANLSRWEEAEAELREALRLDPSLGWARYNLAGLLATARADTDAAAGELRAVRTAGADSSLIELADAYLRQLTLPRALDAPTPPPE